MSKAEDKPADADLKQQMRRYSRRGFLSLGLGAAGTYFGWRWVSSGDVDGIPLVLRRALEFNESLATSLYSPLRMAPTFDVSEARMPRVNGTDGLDDDFNPAKWKLQIVGVYNETKYAQYVTDIDYETDEGDSDADSSTDDDNSSEDQQSDQTDVATDQTDSEDGNQEVDKPAIPGLLLTIDEIKKLPRYEMVTELKCIEGWSEKVHWAGARLADLIAMYPPANRDGSAPDLESRPQKLVRYVSMQTPGEGYYVGLDMPAALHPQTLLCYEMNGAPLTIEHGAPLRLVTPLKYGIKHIKRIGRITFTDDRPKDFWAERGYDWYAGH